MIDLDYRRTTPKRILTPGEKAAVIASSKDLAEQGYPVQQEYLTGDFDSLGGGDGGVLGPRCDGAHRRRHLANVIP